MVLFGGRGPAGEHDDTWVYDVAIGKWTEMNPSTKPSIRRGHALAYDSANDKVVLFGGTWSMMPVYANNAAALVGGLTEGDFYKTASTGDAQVMVVNAT